MTVVPWRVVKLGDVCELNPSKKEVSSLREDEPVSFLPMASVSENGRIIAEQERLLKDVVKGFTYFREGDILIAKITPCFENGKRALASGLKHKIGFGTTEFHVLRPEKDVLPEWIFYVIGSPKFRKHGGKSMTGSAGQKRVPKKFIEDYTIPLPPLSVQKQIVTILEKAEKLKERREKANEETQKIIQGMYLRTFGNPITNELKLLVVKLGNLSKIDMGGTPNTKVQGYWENGSVLWMKSGDIKGDYISDVPNKISKDGLKNSNAKIYSKGDVVIALNGQGKTRGTTGILAVETSSNQSVASISPDKRKLSSEFLHYNLKLRYKQLRDITGDSQRSGLNLTILRTLDIPLPPLELQNQFAESVKKIEALKARQKKSTQDINQLFDALMQKAFSGGLVSG